RLGVAAHYMPATRRLALAKPAGARSLAHEWVPPFDHYMGGKAYRDAGPCGFASGDWLNSVSTKPHPLNERIGARFQAITLPEDGTAPSALFRASQVADQHLKTVYYAKPEELCARAFEAFIEDGQPRNRCLVNGPVHSDEAKAGLYPQGEHRQRINDAFQ